MAVLGFTFKENCPDTRNTRVIDIIDELGEYGITPVIVDPIADAGEARKLYEVSFASLDDIRDMDVVVLAVSHTAFAELNQENMDKFYGAGKRILIDVKGMLSRDEYEKAGYEYWRL